MGGLSAIEGIRGDIREVNEALATLVATLITVFRFLILIDVIGSWILMAGARLPAWVYDVLNAVRTLVGPLLNPIRRFMPNLGGLDLSPLIALLLLEFVGQAIVSALRGRI
jgi:YggT family protein